MKVATARSLCFSYSRRRNPDGFFIYDCLASHHRYDAGVAMSDLIFIGVIVALYAISHALVLGLAKLGAKR